MSRKANAPFTSDSVKHIAIDNVDTRVLEIAMRTLANLPVSNEDKEFAAMHIGTISTLWAKFKQFRTAFESVDLFAEAMAANMPSDSAEKPAA